MVLLHSRIVDQGRSPQDCKDRKPPTMLSSYCLGGIFPRPLIRRNLSGTGCEVVLIGFKVQKTQIKVK